MLFKGSLRYTYLLWPVPLLPAPLLVQEQLVVLVSDNGWGESPWTLKTTASAVATSQGMSSGKSNDLLVVETHSVEDISQVLVTLGSIWKPSIRCASSHVLIQSSWSVWDGWALHLLDGANTSEDPEVRVGDPWVSR